MRVIAHRGFAATAPENTIEAIGSVATKGADAVEFDVRRCGSGELVVIHDETIDRVTGGEGTVTELSLDELRTKTVLESGERIPTLEEVLDAIPVGVEVNCELKDTGIAVDALAALADADLPSRVVLTSFLRSELRTVRERDPDRSTGLLVRRDLEHPVTSAVELGCDVIGAEYRRCLVTRLPDRADAVDLEIHAWGVPNRLAAQAVALRGVDWVSSDRPLGRRC